MRTLPPLVHTAGSCTRLHLLRSLLFGCQKESDICRQIRQLIGVTCTIFSTLSLSIIFLKFLLLREKGKQLAVLKVSLGDMLLPILNHPWFGLHQFLT